MVRIKSQIISVADNVEKVEPSYTVGENEKRCSCWKQSGTSSIIIQFPHDPAVPLLSIYSNEMKIYVHTNLINKCS